MPIPKRRLVISKDEGMKTEPIPITTEKSVIFTKSGKKKGVVRYLQRKANIKKRRTTQRIRDRKTRQAFKHWKVKGSAFHFQRIESLVKNKHSVEHSFISRESKTKKQKL